MVEVQEREKVELDNWETPRYVESEPAAKLDPEMVEDVDGGDVRGLNRKVVVGIGAAALGLIVLVLGIQIFKGSGETQGRDETFSEVTVAREGGDRSQGIDELESSATRKQREERRAEARQLLEEYHSGEVPLEAQGDERTDGDNSEQVEEEDTAWTQAREQANQRNAQAYFQESFAARRADVFARVSVPQTARDEEDATDLPPELRELQASQREMMAGLSAARAQAGGFNSLIAYEDRGLGGEGGTGERRGGIYRGSPEDWVNENQNMLRGASKFSVQAGTLLKMVLETGINSDVPGLVKARIQSPVYDTVTGEHLLIPSGASVIGEYQSEIGYGQERVAVAWQRLILPNGRSIMLHGLPGTDMAGQTGLADRVDAHWSRVIGVAALASILSTSAGVAAGPRSMLDESPGQSGLSAFGADVAEHGQSIVDRQLDVAPTIRIRPGTQVAALVREDLILEPYRGQ